jgi:alpha-aminoadipic semialdehyde synthase
LRNDEIDKMGNPIDSLANYLSKRLGYAKHERDILIMHHEIGYTWSNGIKETKHVDFIQYGDVNGFSAMAKTVGYPTAITAKMVLEKEIQKTGMVLPLTKDIYESVLRRLGAEGLQWHETVITEE